MKKPEYITPTYKSNCLFEAIRAKCTNPKIKIYFCKPRITENKHFQMCHFMWCDGINSYDFSDDESCNLPWYKCFLFNGKIRKFDKDFAEKYSSCRNNRRVEK